MAIRAYGNLSLLVFLEGAGEGGIFSPLPSPNGSQPADEKDLGYPAVFGFHVEQNSSPINVFGVAVDESTQ